MNEQPASHNTALPKLQPCPFCGSDRVTIQPWFDRGQQTTCYSAVVCQKCLAAGPPAFPAEAAAALWNGRSGGDGGGDG